MVDADKPRVLVVDDASLVRLYYRDALEAAGFQVDEAINGLEALEKLLLAPVDLLVVDVNMPRMDGLTFVQTLRRQPMELASIPVLMTSTEAGAQDIAAARAAGANVYLVKPLAQETLADYARALSGASA
ncbi:response regulator [Caulobacter sp. S45]|uniref:response regulator n=1 Tax=Caulobacter sp. S45 TaxID=1641861 RepID=UPI00131E6695|nr:response regulator [Caulobacter sp. S45]